MTVPINIPDMSMIKKEHLLKLLDEAQHTTLLLLSWAGSFDAQKKGPSANADLSPYYLKWIDLAKVAVNNMKDDIDDASKKQLIDDMVTIAVVPIQGMQYAMRMIAQKANVALPESKLNGIDDISEYKKVAIAELEHCIDTLKKKEKKS